MRVSLFSVFAVLLLAGLNDARPPKAASPEVAVEEASIGGKDDDSSWRPTEQRSSSAVQSDSRPETPGPQREVKDLQYMDQSLRTVATQLLNVSNPEESTDPKDVRKIANGELAPNVLLIRKQESPAATPSSNVNQQNFNMNTKNGMESLKDMNSEMDSLDAMSVSFGRPVNSKFGYFESSHPGQAMAMTEEELERELMTSTTRLITAHKNRPTTTGGISTWILLNPPTTMISPAGENSGAGDDEEVNVEVSLQTKLPTPEKIIQTIAATDVPTSSEKNLPESTTAMKKISSAAPKATTPIVKKTTPTVRPTTEKPAKSAPTTLKITQAKAVPTTPATRKENDATTTPKPISASKKTGVSNRPTQKTKVTTPRSANVTSKPMTTRSSRPNQSTKAKPSPTRKVTPKPIAETAKIGNTPKIEKVTFRPVHMITTPKSLIESVERPIFLTKLKASFVADPNSKTKSAPSNSTTLRSEDKMKNEEIDVSVKPKPQASTGIKTNNVLKVQLKKPAESPKVEIQSVTVNEPVLRIEKIVDTKRVPEKETDEPVDSTILDNSRIDLKFDFSPELTKIDTATSTETAPRPSTTKRSHKRKKNKLRRRKPTTSAGSSTTSASTLPEITTESSTTQNPTTLASTAELEEISTQVGITDNSIQESKIEPEFKASPGKTKNKKKQQQQQQQQVQKPIGTQIYNFLSREVMPSFGMMSLVGLGLGLASYFLYPFGGVAARRNYVVEPNYKYNLDEYGGNYGQNEEEVFSKVLQGMTNNDGKYGGIKDYENNFYRYQQYDGAYSAPPTTTTTTTRKDSRYSTSSSPNYRSPETTIYGAKYRNTEFKYPDITTTPNYYQRPKQTSYPGKNPGNGDSRFVVGNVPKEYIYDDKSNIPSPVTIRTNFERETAQNDEYLQNSGNISPSYGRPEALKSNDDYEEIVITPAAVAVEHGPRSLNIDTPRSRRKRESVIQLIPSRVEIKKEEEEIEKEEPLSNEILDIIDSVIPGDGKISHNSATAKDDEKKSHEMDKKKTTNEMEKKVADVDTSKKIDTTETAEATTQSAINVTSKAAVEISTSTSTTAAPTSSTTTVKSLTIDEILGTTTSSVGKDPDSNVEWFDHTTTEKPQDGHFGIFNFVRKLAEVKLKLGLAILKHASEGFARYLGHVQKRVNGEE